jgi:hypothetical protein
MRTVVVNGMRNVQGRVATAGGVSPDAPSLTRCVILDAMGILSRNAVPRHCERMMEMLELVVEPMGEEHQHVSPFIKDVSVDPDNFLSIDDQTFTFTLPSVY